MSNRDQPTIDAANELLRITMTEAIHLRLAGGNNLYMGSDKGIASLLADKDQSGAAVRGEAVAEDRPLYWAAINCAHMIDADAVTLYADPELPGNALSQLGDRLDAAAAKLSARAADAPSEPSNVAMLRQALVDLHHAIQFAHDSLGGGIHKMPTMLHQPGTVTEFIENVLSSTAAAHDLDFQPANTGWKLVPSEPTEAMLRSAVSYREVDANDEIQDPVLSILDRQYRAMLAAADALDSQPTEPYKLESNEQYNVQMAAIGAAAFGYCKLDGIQPEYMTQPLRNVVALYEKYAALLASSQPTDGGVRNG